MSNVNQLLREMLSYTEQALAKLENLKGQTP